MSEVTFGLGIPPSVLPGTDPVAIARMAEDLGFDFVSASDHPCGTEPTYETWTMLSWIAAATSRIRVATRVLGVPYRNPAMVAKMAETFDRLSGGRLILGLGGGYSDAEFRAFGLGTFSARDKVDGLEEAIRITRGLWSQPAFTYSGHLHHTDGADLEPKPVQPIPIWLGTFGDRALRVTGQLADGWIPSYGNRPLHEYAAMREHVLTAAHEAGRDPTRITCALHMRSWWLIRDTPGEVFDPGCADGHDPLLRSFFPPRPGRRMGVSCPCSLPRGRSRIPRSPRRSRPCTAPGRRSGRWRWRSGTGLASGWPMRISRRRSGSGAGRAGRRRGWRW
jgi:alkanesulfonate monooxygenase SsuD/methylene tetrahydromethanopterin reductase-like flavin-dependent oxidoreductase (luciferase family)